ncbi:MAG: hypothetical protein RL115_2007 [Bacteroidota bacterium]
MEVKRKKLQGPLNILDFNRHFYFWGIGFFVIIFIVWQFFNGPSFIFGLLTFATLYALLMPLLIAGYVYDFSGFYELLWISQHRIKNGNEKMIVNINAGFDETSFQLKAFFPQATIKVFDFYDGAKHTEHAIVRARKETANYLNTEQIVSTAIPLQNRSVDIVFLIFAAHEIRSNKEKILFLKECKRVCTPTGKVIMVEHLRDIPNFLAFTIGFTHFFSRRCWRKAFAAAGFNTITEKKFTCFISIFKAS